MASRLLSIWAAYGSDRRGDNQVAALKPQATDLPKSVSYRSLLGLAVQYKFVEQGELCGASLINRATGVIVALRDYAGGSSHLLTEDSKAPGLRLSGPPPD